MIFDVKTIPDLFLAAKYHGLDGADRHAGNRLNFLDFIALGVMQVVLRYGLLAGIGLLARPIPLKVAVAFFAFVFLVVDVLATTGVFSLYSAVMPRPTEPFIYFQF